jgi:endo-1,4-beta-D-glucanase Y
MRITKELFLIFIALLISGLTHGYNMFGFPYYENDEGTYLSQAWSVISEGKLAPYTYWYDHAPVGWIFTAVWLLLTGGLFTFGASLNSGRVFMLVIHLASSYLLIRIGKKLTGNVWPGIIGTLIFSLSPLGLYFQRRLLLDNIMIFWVLWAYYLLLGPVRKLSSIMLSGLFLGIAVLSKENAVFFIPGFLYTIYKNVQHHNKRFALVSWLVIFSSFVSLYLLYALISGELFPYGSRFGGDSPHVSLIATLKYQASRKGGSILQITQSSFWKNYLLWIKQDLFIIWAGIVCNLVLIVISLLKKKYIYLGICLLSIFFWFFLLRGGTVIEFYIVPLLPILSLIIGITFYEILTNIEKLLKIKTRNSLSALLFIITLFIYFPFSQTSRAFGQDTVGQTMYKSNQTLGQVQAIDWMRIHIPADSIIVIDNYSYLDLHIPKKLSGIVFPNSHYYWKIDQDNEIKNDLLKNNPEAIDYIATTPQMSGDLLGNISPLTIQALSNASMVKSLTSNGWGVEIWATRYPGKILYRSWETYKKQFLKDGNHSVDPNQNNITTSEGQSYILLRSVWMNDKDTFDKAWGWTSVNLKNQNGVFSWKWDQDNGSATDADTDIALSLLMAYKQWGNESYLDEAKKLLNSIWETEVRLFQGRYYILPGNWAMGNSTITINPSYLSPYAYRIFSEVDPAHPWEALIDTSYEALNGCMSSPLFLDDSPVNLPPNWCALDKNGQYSQAEEPGLGSTEYSYDAVRVMWRLALDYKWNHDSRAKYLLDLSSEFLLKKLDEDGKILVGYTHDGKPWEEYESVLGYSATLANFAITSPKRADEIYKNKVLDKFYEDFDKNLSYWEDPKNYYIQNWAWFSTALYADKLPNLWINQ